MLDTLPSKLAGVLWRSGVAVAVVTGVSVIVYDVIVAISTLCGCVNFRQDLSQQDHLAAGFHCRCLRPRLHLLRSYIQAFRRKELLDIAFHLQIRANCQSGGLGVMKSAITVRSRQPDDVSICTYFFLLSLLQSCSTDPSSGLCFPSHSSGEPE